jgi:hypothetical protein
MVLETNSVTVLIRDLTGVVQRGILVNDRRGWLQDIHKKHTEKQAH